MTSPIRKAVQGKRTARYEYRIGRIPGVGVNLAARRLLKNADGSWWYPGRVRNLGTSPRAMRIARLIGRL